MLRTLLAVSLLPLAPALGQTPWLPKGAQEFLVPVAPAESLRVTVAGSGEPVILVPGLFGSAYGYRNLLLLLPAAGFRTIVIEPLGIGRSPRPRHANYSLTAQADRIAVVLRELGERPAIVVGHSVGASIVLRLAYRHPERVRALVALDGGPAEQAATPGLQRAMRYASWVKWLGGVKRIRPQMRKGLLAASGDPSWITDEVMDRYTAGARADLDGTLLAFLAMVESREPERIGSHLAEIRCPVRLVIGTVPHEGGIEEKQIRLLRDRLPDFRIDSVPGAGQYLFEEQPSSVAALIREAGVGSSASPAAVP